MHDIWARTPMDKASQEITAFIQRNSSTTSDFWQRTYALLPLNPRRCWHPPCPFLGDSTMAGRMAEETRFSCFKDFHVRALDTGSSEMPSATEGVVMAECSMPGN